MQGKALRRWDQDQQEKQHKQRMTVYGMKLAGHTNQQIAEHLGVTATRVWQLFRDAMRDVERETVEMVRHLEVGRLDVALRATVEVLREASRMVPAVHPITGRQLLDADGEPLLCMVDAGAVLTAVDRIVKIGESRRKLVDADERRAERTDTVDEDEEAIMRIVREQRRSNRDDDLKAESGF